MSFELDHIFILTDVGAPEADRLTSIGLTEGSSRVHQGQGTTNRRFFFHNFMLELLWVSDAEEARSPLTSPMYLWERWSDLELGTCPFGFCLRPANEPPDDRPFPAWEYHPVYLPPNLNNLVGNNVSILREPMLFYLSFAKRQDSSTSAEPLHHRVGFQELTRLTFFSPHNARPSPELQAMVDMGAIKLKWEGDYLLELGFDGERQGERVDLKPDLPLILCW